ncbi:unnamed protein product [Symbiodinium necroappetens]|uniref:Ubiquitin-like domain-containing protein n=1 Tax=Symbiodinium necroappetens TaxID=1628268 RepID=A0A812PXK9_9DINO|nr:unnamed protein product [Symbiodinium necroappetens]
MPRSASSEQESPQPSDTANEETRPSPDGSRMLRLQIVDGTGQERRVDIHVDPTTTVAQLKDGNYLGVDFAVGWRLRCVFRGRLLSEMEPLGRLPSGAFLQCYLQRPSTVESADGLELDPLLVAWARLAGVGRNSFPPEKWQDVVFHCAFIIGLAVAWSAYLGSPDVFDGFGRLALRFLTISWASFLDVLRPFRKNFILPQPVQCGQMCCWVPRFLHSTYPCTSPSA